MIWLCFYLAFQGPGPHLSISKAIFEKSEKIEVYVTGIRKNGIRSTLEVAFGTGDQPDFSECLVVSRQSSPSRGGTIHDSLSAAELLIESEAKSCNTSGVHHFWVRVQIPGEKQVQPIMFGISTSPCSLLASIIDIFYHGQCDPNMKQILDDPRR